MDERTLITYPTWERYTVLSHSIAQLSIRQRRHIFQLALQPDRPDGPLLSPLRLHFAEFAVWYTLADTRRKSKRGRVGADPP